MPSVADNDGKRSAEFVEGSLGPLIAVSVDRPPTSTELDSLTRSGADIVEWRVDRFEKPLPSLLPGRTNDGRPLSLLTVRNANEGGGWKGTEDERLSAYLGSIERFDLVDVEVASGIAASVVASARSANVRTILSAHQMERAFESKELDAIATGFDRLQGDVLKIACVVNSESEFRRITNWLLSQESRAIAVVLMGTWGPASRCLFPLLGSLVTYAHAASHTATSGQLSLDETYRLLRALSPRFASRTSSERLDDDRI